MDLCIYLESTITGSTSSQSVLNRVSALKYASKFGGFDQSIWESLYLKLYLRGIRLSLPKVVREKGILSASEFYLFCKTLDKYGKNGHTLRLAYQLGFFGLLRMSNVAPASLASFDPKRNTRLRDLTVTSTGVSVKLKWSKTRQSEESTYVKLPAIGVDYLNPILSYDNMIKFASVVDPNGPLLRFTDGKVVTAGFLNKCFKSTLLEAGICTSGLTFHALHRSAASLTFQQGATSMNIAKQGTWKSLIYLDYILMTPDTACPLQEAFDKMFKDVAGDNVGSL